MQAAQHCTSSFSVSDSHHSRFTTLLEHLATFGVFALAYAAVFVLTAGLGVS